MSTRTHVLIVLVAVAIAVIVLRLVATRQLRSKYALVWLFVALALIPVAAVPSVLEELADLVGISYAPTIFLVLAIGLLGALVGHLTWEVSRLEMRIRTLAEDQALLRNRLDERVSTPVERAPGES